jgi:hypothetical protein
MPKEIKEPAAQIAVTAVAASPQLSVREWALSQAGLVGMETALAFVSLYAQDTGTADELERALGQMCSRVVHQE